MDSKIQQFLKEKSVSFYIVRTPDTSPYKIYSLQSKTHLKIILVANTLENKVAAIYWNNINNFAIDMMLFPHYESMFKDFNKIEEYLVSDSILNNKPDEFYLEIILLNELLKDNTFAQSLAKTFVEKRKLSDKQLVYVVGPTPNGRPPLQTQVIKSMNVFIAYFENCIKNNKGNAEVPIIREFLLKPTKGQDVTLIATKEHKYYQYPFDNFNPVQSLVYPYVEVDSNVVVGANTSAGKTICAEILMDKVLAEGKKIIYLSPLKSLTQEKYEDWKIRFPDKVIEIMTGDYTLSDAQIKKLNGIDIVCMTSEMLDSRTRKFDSEKNTWLYNVGLLVCDEIHIIGTEGRGHACETGIMRFTQINPESRVLFLSATMPNVEEFGEWLTTLNGKHTGIVYCDWRPVTLQMNFVEYENIGSYYEIRDNKIDSAIDVVLQKPNEKFLVFVHDKGTGRDIVKKFAQAGIKSMFHNADLDIENRLEIERQFKDRKEGLRVLVSTSTLAWGMNLPARNVVIVGVHRGINEVDELDIIQMCGRAGRYGIDDSGFVYMIVPMGSTERWRARLANPRPVTSYLKKLEILAFHILSEINTKNINNTSDVEKWYSRSLAAIQNINIQENEADLVIQDLLNMNMIKQQRMGNAFKITNMGVISALMYYSPYDIHGWHRNFEQVFKNEIENEVVIAWAVTDVPSNRLSYMPKNMINTADNLKKVLTRYGIDYSYTDLTSINWVMAATHCLEGSEPSDPALKSVMRGFQYDSPRMISALEMLDANYSRWGFDWKEFGLRTTYGVPKQMLDLVRIEGVGKARAEKLYSLGLRDAASIASVDANKLQPLFTLKLAKDIIKNAQKLNKRK